MSGTTAVEVERVNVAGWLSSMERVQVSEDLARLKAFEGFATYVFVYGPLGHRHESGRTFGTTLEASQLRGLAADIRSGAVMDLLTPSGVLHLHPGNRDEIAAEVEAANVTTAPVA